KKSHLLDVLPFGGVEDASHKIVWPPELSVVMNVAGYREALEGAKGVEIARSFVVRVASLSGLAVLKLLAWADRGIEDPRDATDLVIIMRRHEEAGNEDLLYGQESGERHRSRHHHAGICRGWKRRPFIWRRSRRPRHRRARRRSRGSAPAR